jgi:hypothetical protein
VSAPLPLDRNLALIFSLASLVSEFQNTMMTKKAPITMKKKVPTMTTKRVPTTTKRKAPTMMTKKDLITVERKKEKKAPITTTRKKGLTTAEKKREAMSAEKKREAMSAARKGKKARTMTRKKKKGLTTAEKKRVAMLAAREKGEKRRKAHITTRKKRGLTIAEKRGRRKDRTMTTKRALIIVTRVPKRTRTDCEMASIDTLVLVIVFLSFYGVLIWGMSLPLPFPWKRRSNLCNKPATLLKLSRLV